MSASVTICLCTCDGASHLAQQLASLASQTRLPDEVVISDDGSKDGTLDLLERWAASVATSVLIERRADPVGHVANLEGALRRARSDIVFICDQDDRWNPEKVQRMALVLEAAPAVAGAFCDSALIDEVGDPLAGSLWQTLRFAGAEQASVAAGRGLEVLLRRNVVAGHALALRRDRLDLLLPFPEIDHADWWLALGLLLDGGLVPVNERLVEYRLHSGNRVGLRSRTSFARRITSTSPRARSRTDAGLLEDLLRRFDDLRPGLSSDEDRALVQAKIAHSSRRGSLPSRRLTRVVPVAKGLAHGDYRRFSNGWRSALIDLAAPAR
ncbi:MAG: glycosyltransferase [Acidimicrobiales bacterium]